MTARSAPSQVEIQSAQVAASRLGLEIVVVYASAENEIENALAAAVEQRAAAIVVAFDVFFSGAPPHATHDLR